MKEDKTKTAVAKTGAGAVTTPLDYGSDVNGGFENQTREDISIPFINVLQDNSQEAQNNDDAKAGMLFNTVTGELIDGNKGVLLIPALTQHVFVEWIPRDEGGGFVGVHKIDSEVVAKAKAESKDPLKLKHGKNDLVETFYVYGNILNEEGQTTGMAVIGCKSKFIAPYKRWNTSLNMFTVKTPDGRKQRPPLFAHTVRLTTFKDKNKKGVFYNIKLGPAKGSVAESLLPPGDARLEEAKALRDMVLEGVASAAYDTQTKGEGTETATEEAF